MRLSRRAFLGSASSLVGIAAYSPHAFAATGDITAVQVESTGWSALVTIASFTTGETFAFGDPILSVAKFVLTVVTTGYDTSGNAVTPTHNIYGTHVIRDPYPNQATNNETLGGGGVIVRIALSEWVASGDTVTANVASGCFINTGGAAQTSNTLSAFSCTNSSTYVHPVAFGTWASRPYDRWQANPTLSVSARHRLGINAVKIILTDGTNTVTTAATKVANQRTGTNASGYYAEEWSATCSLSTLNQNAAITARFQLFPIIGASYDTTNSSGGTATFTNGSANIGWTGNALSQNTQVKFTTTGSLPTGFSTATVYYVLSGGLTATNFQVATSANGSPVSASSAGSGTQKLVVQTVSTLSLGNGNFPYWNDKSAALDVYAVVNQSTGNDSTGVSSATLATAAASPYATIAKALTVGTANIIYLKQAGTGTYVFSGATVRPSDFNYWRRILPYPGDTGVIMTMTGTVQPNVQALSIEGNIQFKMLSGANWIDGQTTDTYAWSNINFNSNSIVSNTVPVPAYRANCVYIQNSTFDNIANWGLWVGFAANIAIWYDGCVMPTTSGQTLTAVKRFIANNANFCRIEDPFDSTSTSAKPDPYIIEFNSMSNCADGAPGIKWFYNGLQGFSACGNIMERATGGSSPLFQILADAGVNGALHTIIWHNTDVGQRDNLLYNEVTQAATFTNGSASIGWPGTPGLVINSQVVLNTTGTLPTNFSPNVTYYVVAAGLTATTFELAATQGGAAIVAGSAGSGTHTATLVQNFTGSSVKFNSFWQAAIKTDTFTGSGYTQNGARVGNWADVYGVGHVSNQEQSNNLAFGNEFPGIGSAFFPATPTNSTPVSTPNYVNDASITGSGVGSGSYKPNPYSSLLKTVPAGYAVLGWDLFGNTISNTGNGSTGAIQATQQPPTSTQAPGRGF